MNYICAKPAIYNGKRFEPGQVIPDEQLEKSRIRKLLNMGLIKALIEPLQEGTGVNIPENPSSSLQAPEPPQATNPDPEEQNPLQGDSGDDQDDVAKRGRKGGKKAPE